MGYLDYGWRMHDKALGRWFGVDKLSEMMPSISGYAYCLNNPVNYRDLFGLFPKSDEDIAFSIYDPREVIVKPDGKNTSSSPSSFGGLWYYPGMKPDWDKVPDWDKIEQQAKANSESRRVERDLFLQGLASTDKYLSGSLGLVGIGIEGYNQIPHPALRHHAYEFTKKVNKFIGSKTMKPGKAYQGMEKIVKNAGKGVGKIGTAGTFLQGAIIVYEVTTGQWDAHTVVNGVLLVGGIFATVSAAPVVLIGIGVYGIADMIFDVGDKIDGVAGRNSGMWN